jgi:hypothetical protein
MHGQWMLSLALSQLRGRIEFPFHLPSELIDAPLNRNSLSPIWIGNTFRAGNAICIGGADACEGGKTLRSNSAGLSSPESTAKRFATPGSNWEGEKRSGADLRFMPLFRDGGMLSPSRASRGFLCRWVLVLEGWTGAGMLNSSAPWSLEYCSRSSP